MQTIAAGSWSGVARPRRGRQIAVVVLALLALWMVVGLVRGPSLGAAAFSAFESPRSVSAIQTTAIGPFVSVEGTVTEASGASYTAAQVFLVEPLSGWWLNLSQLGIAPSGG